MDNRSKAFIGLWVTAARIHRLRLAWRMGRRRRDSAAEHRPPPREAAAPRGAAPRIPGHELVGPAGFGANGPVWSARDGAGHDVVVSVLPLPRGEAGTAQLRRLAALRHGAHPHLAPIRQVVSVDAHRCAVVSDRVSGPTLATVCAARGALEEEELAAVLAGIGNALGHLHERGVVHGDVSPANVIVTDGGVPVLVDLAGQVSHELGTAGFVPPERQRGAAAGAPGDVWALAQLVAWAAGDRASPRVLQLLGAALDVEPARRPGARDLASCAPALGPRRRVEVPSASALAQARMRDEGAPTRRRPTRRAQVPAPRTEARSRRPARSVPRGSAGAQGRAGTQGRVGGSGTSRRSGQPDGQAALRHARRRPPRSRPVPMAWLWACVGVGTVAVLTGIIVWSGPADRAGSDGHASAGRDAQHPHSEVVAELLVRRDDALMARDTAALAATSVPGGTAAREDAVLLDRLAATETVLENLRTAVTAVEGVTEVADGTAVDVVLVQAAHDRVVGDRRVAVSAQPPQCTRVVLADGEDDGQRILRSEPCP